MAQLCLYAIK